MQTNTANLPHLFIFSKIKRLKLTNNMNLFRYIQRFLYLFKIIYLLVSFHFIYFYQLFTSIFNFVRKLGHEFPNLNAIFKYILIPSIIKYDIIAITIKKAYNFLSPYLLWIFIPFHFEMTKYVAFSIIDFTLQIRIGIMNLSWFYQF